MKDFLDAVIILFACMTFFSGAAALVALGIWFIKSVA